MVRAVLGETLRRRRVQRGLELADVAAELGVPAKSVRALEWDRPDLVGAPGDADRIAHRYAAFLDLEVEMPAPAPLTVTAGTAATAPASKTKRALWWPILAALAPAVVIGVVYLLGRESDGESAREVDSQPRASAIASNPHPGVSGESEPQRAAPGGAKRPVNLVVTADRGGSWVEAHSDSASGPLLYQGTLENGRELRLAAQRIWLRLGAASNVSLALNGRVTPREFFGTVDVVVTTQGIKPSD
jgi:transcriptional regulator with XRE-family HTH domain